MRGWALGLLGMSRDEFYLTRPGEFWEALSAFRREKDDDRRHLGELARGISIRSYNLQVAKRYRKTDPASYWPMPWDDETDGTPAVESLDLEGKREKAKELLDKLKLNG